MSKEIEEIEYGIKHSTKDRDTQYWLGRKHSYLNQQQKIEQLEKEVEEKEKFEILLEACKSANKDYSEENTKLKERVKELEEITDKLLEANEDGNVLDEPNYSMFGYDHKYKQYQEAKERVLFNIENMNEIRKSGNGNTISLTNTKNK